MLNKNLGHGTSTRLGRALCALLLAACLNMLGHGRSQAQSIGPFIGGSGSPAQDVLFSATTHPTQGRWLWGYYGAVDDGTSECSYGSGCSYQSTTPILRSIGALGALHQTPTWTQSVQYSRGTVDYNQRFEDWCPTNYVVKGFSVTWGASIDQVRITCVHWEDVHYANDPAYERFSAWNDWKDGTGGPNYQIYRCPAGEAVQSFLGYREDLAINRLAVYCDDVEW